MLLHRHSPLLVVLHYLHSELLLHSFSCLHCILDFSFGSVPLPRVNAQPSPAGGALSTLSTSHPTLITMPIIGGWGVGERMCSWLGMMLGESQVWNERHAQEEVLGMVIRTGLYTTMGTMLKHVIAPLDAVNHLKDPAVAVSQQHLLVRRQLLWSVGCAFCSFSGLQFVRVKALIWDPILTGMCVK